LQGRLKDGGEKPAQIVLVFEGVKRPEFQSPRKIINGQTGEVEDEG
jgi:hypothetical protein